MPLGDQTLNLIPSFVSHFVLSLKVHLVRGVEKWEDRKVKMIENI